MSDPIGTMFANASSLADDWRARAERTRGRLPAPGAMTTRWGGGDAGEAMLVPVQPDHRLMQSLESEDTTAQRLAQIVESLRALADMWPTQRATIEPLVSAQPLAQGGLEQAEADAARRLRIQGARGMPPGALERPFGAARAEEAGRSAEGYRLATDRGVSTSSDALLDLARGINDQIQAVLGGAAPTLAPVDDLRGSARKAITGAAGNAAPSAPALGTGFAAAFDPLPRSPLHGVRAGGAPPAYASEVAPAPGLGVGHVNQPYNAVTGGGGGARYKGRT